MEASRSPFCDELSSRPHYRLVQQWIFVRSAGTKTRHAVVNVERTLFVIGRDAVLYCNVLYCAYQGRTQSDGKKKKMN